VHVLTNLVPRFDGTNVTWEVAATEHKADPEGAPAEAERERWARAVSPVGAA